MSKLVHLERCRSRSLFRRIPHIHFLFPCFFLQLLKSCRLTPYKEFKSTQVGLNSSASVLFINLTYSYCYKPYIIIWVKSPSMNWHITVLELQKTATSALVCGGS